MIACQWIRIPLAEVKNLSIPTKISRVPVKITPLQGEEKIFDEEAKESFQS